MECLRRLLFLALIGALLLSRNRITWAAVPHGDWPRHIHVAAILPDAAGRRSSTWVRRGWPFSIQNVSPAIDVALRRVNNQRIAFDVK